MEEDAPSRFELRARFVFKSMNFVCQNDGFCIKNDEFCMKNDEYCIKHDGLWARMTVRSGGRREPTEGEWMGDEASRHTGLPSHEYFM